MAQVNHKKFDGDWNLSVTSLRADGSIEGANTEQIVAANLILIRDAVRENTSELRKLNRLLHCSNFIGIPKTLRSIEKAAKTRKRCRRAHAYHQIKAAKIPGRR